jgi:hypothetical protein
MCKLASKSLHLCFRYQSQNQLTIKEFEMPFEAELDANNRWVVMSQMIPWDELARAYQKNFPSRRGAPTIDARIILGVVIIKHLLKLDDEGVIEMIQENPYMQYFLGLKSFSSKPVMDPSLLVHIRKRIDLSVFEKLTDELIREGLKLNRQTQEAQGDDDSSNDDIQKSNKGKLQMDATVADADIKFPTDLYLLNDSREKAEELIDYLCGELGVNHKPRTYRRNARKAYLNLSKKKRKSEKELRKGIRQQLGFVRRDIKIINQLLDKSQKIGLGGLFDKHQQKYFFVIQHVFSQQESMFKGKVHSVDDRIVSIHQPHVRPIVRGKAKSKVEFGAKINVSLHDGYARIDHFDWNAYNEGTDLIMQVERYRELHGHYPKVVLVDKIYLNRENRRWLKEHGIKHTGDPLGRKRVVNQPSAYQKRKKRSECAERNQIEGKFGQGKRGYNLNNIRARLSSTSTSWIAAIIFVMNILRHMKGISLSIFEALFDKFMRMKQIIKNQIPNPTYNFAGFGIIQ